jgi:hypothetical protein
MLEQALWEGLITGAIALVILLVGSVLMWLTLGKYMITNYASKKLESSLQDAYENPEGENGQMVANLSQLALVAALKSLSELIPEDPNQPAHPMVNSFFRRAEDHIFKGIMGAFGRQMKKMQEGGAGAPAGLNPAGLMGMLGGAKGGSDSMGSLGSIMSLMQMFAGMQGGGSSQPKSGGSGWL